MRMRSFIAAIVMCLAALEGWCGGPAKWNVIDKKTMAADMMQVTKRFQHMKVYQVKVTHASYTDYTTPVAYQTSNGYFKRENKNFHNYILGIHTIQSNGCRLVVDTAKRILAVADPTEAMDSIMPVSDYTQVYGLCTTIRKSVSGSTTIYRMDFDKKYPVSALEFTVEDSLPAKIVMYYNREVTKGSMKAKPRLEIEFNGWTTHVSEPTQSFDITAYVDKKGNKYSAKVPYLAKYKLLDERVLTRNDKK